MIKLTMIKGILLRSFRVCRWNFSLLFCLTLICPVLVAAQPDTTAALTFTVEFPKSQPEHYSIRVPSDGVGHYQSSGPRAEDSGEADSFDLDFSIAPNTRQKIFELAAKAGYFQKDVDSHQKGLAFTGTKTLGYKDAQRAGESSYNYSSNAAVQELTSLMQGLSSTLEFGRRLEFDRHYQKLALDEELKRMEEMARSKQLAELLAIQPILDQIVADPSVINVTRARAQRLLQEASGH